MANRTIFREEIARRIASAALSVALAFSGLGVLGGCQQEEPEVPTQPGSSGLEAEDRPATGETTDTPEGTEPEPEPALSEAEQFVAEMTLEEKVAQLFFVTPEAITGVETATAAGEATRAAIEENPVGGIVYFAKNLLDQDQTVTLLSNTERYMREITGLAPFLGVDEEGGTVARIGGNTANFGVDSVGNMCDIGATGDPERARQVGVTIGNYLSYLGFTVDFAPVADVANNPNGSMGLRSFGSDANLVASMVKAEIEGMSSTGILSCAKHFPGIGGADGDSHNVNIYSYKTLDEMRACELLPFEAAIEADVPFIMVGHLSTPTASGNDTPASLNPEIITDLLRNELGYDGIIITDALGMAAVTNLYTPDQVGVGLLQAGGDMILMPADYHAAYQGVLDAVHNGTITEERIDESVVRIVETKTAMDE